MAPALPTDDFRAAMSGGFALVAGLLEREDERLFSLYHTGAFPFVFTLRPSPETRLFCLQQPAQSGSESPPLKEIPWQRWTFPQRIAYHETRIRVPHDGNPSTPGTQMVFLPSGVTFSIYARA